MAKRTPAHSAAQEARSAARQRAAFELWLGLGPKRTLPKLLASYLVRHGAISLRTIKKWSTEGGWIARAKEHDKIQAQRQANELKEGTKALTDAADAVERHTPDLVEKLERLAHQNIDRLLNAEIHIVTPQDARAVAQIVEHASELREMLLEPGSSRTRDMARGLRVEGDLHVHQNIPNARARAALDELEDHLRARLSPAQAVVDVIVTPVNTEQTAVAAEPVDQQSVGKSAGVLVEAHELATQVKAAF